MIDGVSDAARDQLDIVVEGRAIVAVEMARPREAGSATVIDGAGLTLLPGLIDCHAHYTLDPWSADPFEKVWRESDAVAITYAARAARVALHAGITTTRDAGAPRQLNFALRDAIAKGFVPGPRLLAPGCAITITGGHGRLFGIEADGMDALQQAVRAQMRDGADVIKIVASEAAMLTGPEAAVEELSQAEIDMLVGEARRRGLRIFSHAQNSVSVIRSAQAKVDSVEHAFLASKEAISALRDNAVTLVPTLAVTEVTLERDDLTPAFRERMLRIRDKHWWSCEEAIRQGVNVVASTDCGEPQIFPNLLWRDIRVLHDRGLTKMGAIQAATSKAAALLGIGATVGSIAAGMQADLILVQGNPLDDLASLSQVALVMQAGKTVVQV
ncbi:MAG TPA: amidohydrolase family protein [Thermoflexales bacterium]|nr:amidohydrolase family protein [Thermoflexales bacterium]HQY26478.1 amidohydrolase family protein [Thermoflexales bacterium]